MKLHLIKKQTIEDYAFVNSGSRVGFQIWLSVLKYTDWNDPEDIQSTFGTADILGNGTNRVVFNIGGNKHRLICKYQFGVTRIRLFVCWVGTHTEYTELCRDNKQYSISLY
ncbi:MAG: type II toxin-antitoxin system HigB family toxin [Taibaiella sp.]|nr:type II toxin-antitoxin system HigB family toxin [Taibaiella sp.]